MAKHVLFVDGLIGAGKCLAPNTLVAKYNGTVTKAKYIKVGDQLLGDDSTPRNVLSICSGKETMYQIVPKIGVPYTVNESHILTVRCPYNPGVALGRNRSGEFSRYRVTWKDRDGNHARDFTFSILGEENALKQANLFRESMRHKFDIIDISILEFLKRPKTWRSACQTFHVGFDWEEQDVPLDPYIYGLWLGDGACGEPKITNIDGEIIQYCKEFSEMHDMNFKQHACGITYGFSSKARKLRSNYMREQLKKTGSYHTKIINKAYLTNSRENRLKLLAGLIDSDGYLGKGRTYEITQKRKKLSKQIAFLTRSLGFMTNIRKVTKTCTNNGVSGIYYRITFWGDGLEDLKNYVLLDRKKITHLRKTHIVPNTSSFVIDKLDVGEYNGFTIDGNKRFLLGDFTVTHNTTLLRKIQRQYPKLTVIFEPVEKWVDSGLLENFYDNPKKWAFQLQSFIMDSFVEELEKAFENDVSFILMERGHLAAYTIFSYLHWTNGILSDEEYKKMEEKHYWYDRDLRKRGYVLDHIYLNTPIEVAMERVSLRDRVNESKSVSEEYQRTLLARFEELCLTPYTVEQLDELIEKITKIHKPCN